ncbi:MAG: hypothetical protein AAB425_11070, partial [Bdellovibrionota bacterium]
RGRMRRIQLRIYRNQTVAVVSLVSKLGTAVKNSWKGFPPLATVTGSASSVTDRYIHDRGERLAGVANVIQIRKTRPRETGCSQNVPISENSESALK